MEQKAKSIRYTKHKLTAAIAMVLIALVMVSSVTYAWLTLSTAPSVVGVNVAVGANGALEMRLYNAQISGDDATWMDDVDENIAWGNIVDLSDEKYGSQNIKLYPSVLASDNGYISIREPLWAPRYLETGRVDKTEYDKAVPGIFENQSFWEDSGFGFRGVGAVTGLTDRQIAWRDAKNQIAEHMLAAKNATRNSLIGNGGAVLGQIAMKYGLLEDEDNKYTLEERQAIAGMIADLYGALEEVEDAFFNAIKSFAASSKAGSSDVLYLLIQTDIAYYMTGDGAIEKSSDDLDAAIASLIQKAEENGLTVEIPDEINAALTLYKKALADVQAADLAEQSMRDLEQRPDGEEQDYYLWEEIKLPLTYLLDMAQLKINGTPVRDMNQQSMLEAMGGQGGLQIQMGSGSGVYTDIADLCGNYTAAITISGDGVGLDGFSVGATMKTLSVVEPSHLQQVTTGLGLLKPGYGDNTRQELTELYGYIIDLEFRTNAPHANLLLQSDAIDRIYAENGSGSAEMSGLGSSMTFYSNDSNFPLSKVESLMQYFRIVFFDPESGEVFAIACLDMTEENLVREEGVTAKMYILAYATEYRYIDPVTQLEVTVWENDGLYYSDEALTQEVIVDEEMELTATGKVKKVDTDKIVSLVADQEKRVSALIYLDGRYITNKDVAATAATSMTGTMNLQFATDAELVPMENAQLQNK